METFHWTATRSGLIFLPMTVPSLGGSLVGKIIDKFGARIPTAIAFLISSVALGCLRFVTVDNAMNKWLLVGLLILFGLTCLGVQIGLMTEIFGVISDTEESHPQVFGGSSAISQGYGLYTMASAAGLLVGPLLGGFLKNAIGWGGLSLSLASICVLAAVLILRFCGQTKQHS
jgi:MFS family permease